MFNMLSIDQINSIREHLENAQNPIFYYDNDADGLCSFVILRKFIGRGRGVAIRSFPKLDSNYIRKIDEFNSDYVFVLDKPEISEDFVKEVNSRGLTLVWIDHHDIPESSWESSYENFFVYNPSRNTDNRKSSEPTTYLCYKVCNIKHDEWLALVGCISDHYIPDFCSSFAKENPDLLQDCKHPFGVYFSEGLGEIARAINFGIKDSTTNIVRLQNFVLSCNSPRDFFAEVPGNYHLRKKYAELKLKYSKLITKAKECVDGNLVYFSYSGDLSISSEISNELNYIYPKKYIAVIYRKQGVANLSLRGKNVKLILQNVLSKIPYSNGGGHEDAVGGRIPENELNNFKKYLEEEIIKK